jgi:hypothetical protein
MRAVRAANAKHHILVPWKTSATIIVAPGIFVQVIKTLFSDPHDA